MNVQDIQFMYEYNYWANGKILAASEKATEEQVLAPASFPFGGLHGTLLHILDAEYGWRMFFETNSFVEDLDRTLFPTLDSIKEQWAMEEQAMRAYMNGLTDEDMVSHRKYINDEGIHRDRILWHLLIHVVNHGSQHRSEAAALLTDFGSSPGDLDFTLFLIETGNS